jgi:hypothetical protein
MCRESVAIKSCRPRRWKVDRQRALVSLDATKQVLSVPLAAI